MTRAARVTPRLYRLLETVPRVVRPCVAKTKFGILYLTQAVCFRVPRHHAEQSVWPREMPEWTMSRLIFLVLLTSLAACSPAPLSMPYAPTGMVLPDTTHRQTIRVEQATDERREGDRTWFGAIRGGYGNPLKVMHADMPIAEVVGRAFNSALDARGLLAGPSIAPRLALTVTVHEFEVSHMVRRDANMDFSINLTDRSTGRTIWHDRHAVHRVDNRVGLDMGILASPDDLRAFALRAMSEAVDAMLDKPDFRAALR